MQDGNFQEAALRFRVVTCLPGDHFRGWAQYFLGVLNKETRNAMKAFERFGAWWLGRHLRVRARVRCVARPCTYTNVCMCNACVLHSWGRCGRLKGSTRALCTGSAAALMPRTSPCFLNSKAQQLDLVKKAPQLASALAEMDAEARFTHSNMDLSFDTLKAMANTELWQWQGIEYKLPGKKCSDGRIFYVFVLNEAIKLYQGMSDSETAFELWRKYVSVGWDVMLQHVPVFNTICLSEPNYCECNHEDVSEIHMEWGRKVRAYVGRVCRPVPADQDPGRRLKIGYLSPDMRRHPCAYFLEHFLQHHDRSQVRVVVYVCNVQQDDYTDRLRGLADEWVQLTDVCASAEAAAARIREDSIDIAIDLAGHAVARGANFAPVDIFAYYAAPIQCTYLGYPNTTGLDNVQYRFTDAVADPVDSTQKFSEKLVRLPGCFLAFSPPQVIPSVFLAALPASRREQRDARVCMWTRERDCVLRVHVCTCVCVCARAR